MNWTIFIVEAIVLCAAFHMMIYLIIRSKPEWEIYSYPPAITQRWIDLGKVPVKEVLPGTEDMTDEYHDYMYHIKGSVTGMVIGLPVCLLIGLTVQIVTWVWK